ncbi:hypothetical protein SAMN05660453_0046 [Fructobacillus durionis]|uniref:Uncharacterized protein n=1 Tax=Fructobacillus durionis TaxID=283737 RepID=A0A1I1HL92_9LACO|nr:hypothetical protein SAMN05660453_0046 [Fructobacillus durionis]
MYVQNLNHVKSWRRETLNNKKLWISIIAIMALIIVGLVFYVFTSNGKDNTSNTSRSAKVLGVKADYSTSEAEEKLNAGDDLTGKIIDVEILKVENNTELGQNLQAGEHLNFYPDKQQAGLKDGQHIKFKVTDAQSTLGSWLIKGSVVSTK